MKFVTTKIFLVLIFSFVYFFELNNLSVGSDSAVSRQGLVIFPQVDSDNEMKGFGTFENGFTLENSSTTCTFDSFFPVSGTVKMNGGTVYLSKDLIFDGVTNLSNMGNVYGNGLRMKLSESVTTFTVFSSGQTAGTDSSWEQVDSLVKGKPIISVDWTYDDNYVVSINNLNDFYIMSFNGSTLSSVDYIALDTATNSVSAHPSGYYFVAGSNTSGPKDEVNLFKFNGSTLSKIDGKDIDLTVLSVDWRAAGNYFAIGSTDDTRVFSFSSELFSQVAILSLGLGEQASCDSLCWDMTGSYYALGVEHSTNSKLRIYYFNGSNTITEKTYLDTGSDIVTAVDWSKTGSWIAIGTDGSSDQLRVYEYNSSSDVLTEKTKISVGGTVNSVHWNSDANILLVGKALDAGGTELRTYTFDKYSSVLTLDKEAEKSVNINSLCWSHNDSYFVYVDSAHNTTVYSYTAPVVGGDYFSNSVFLDNVSIELSNDMSWKMATTIQGECVIDGCYNRITIEDSGAITVTTGASLTIEKAELLGLRDTNFKCVGDNESIILKNCTIHLDGDFTYGTGALLFEGDVVFTGTNKFIYSSQMTSTISSNSKLMFDHDTTFSFSPSIDNRDLFYMTDETSCLYLNGCTLHSTSTGLRLTRGTLILDNNVTFFCEGTELSEAICFGDGIVDNDLTINILAGAEITDYGALHYNNSN